jgi:putative inorganic carbon (HCO3(-)) transporter
MIFVLPWEDSIATPSLGSVARLVGLVVAGFWFAAIIMEGKFRKPELFHLLALLFFLWNFVSVFWSFGIADTIQRIKTYSQIFLLLLICWDLFQKPEALIAGLQSYILGAYVLVASTIHNYLAGEIAVQYEGRYSATGVNANDVALILILGMPIGLPLAMQLLFTLPGNIKGFWQQLINLLYIPLAIFSIVLTGSRTSMIAIIPFVIFLFGTQRIKIERKILISVILLVSLLVLLPLVPQSVIQRMSTIGASIRGADLGGRVTMWEKSIVVLAQNPIWGVGSGAIDHLIGGAVHNTFISVVTETGFIGLALFLAIVGLVFYRVITLPRETLALWLSIYVTWLIGIVSLSWEFRKVTWILLSFMIIESSLRKKLSEQEQSVNLPECIGQSFDTGESASQPRMI